MNISKEQICKQMKQVFVRTTEMDFSWNWSAGVAFYGIVRAWEVTGETEYIEYLKEWVDAYIEAGIPKFTINAVSIGYALMALHEYTADQKYMDLAVQEAEFLLHDAERFGEGVLQHTVSEKNYHFDEQAWADTLFMAGLFLVKLGKVLERDDYLQDGLKQFYWHIEFLQDKKTNLFYHAWNNIKQDNMSAIHWCRANGWAAITMCEAMHVTDAFEPIFVEISDALRDQLAAVVRLQAEDGLWHTIIDDESSYTETSGSCALAVALIKFCRDGGHDIYRKYILRATDGILKEISENGTVEHVSSGTAVMNDAEGYRRIPNKRIQGWGQGLALAFLAELSTYLDSEGETDQ